MVCVMLFNVASVIFQLRDGNSQVDGSQELARLFDLQRCNGDLLDAVAKPKPLL